MHGRAVVLVLAMAAAALGQPGDCCDWQPTVKGPGKCTEVYCDMTKTECMDYTSWVFNGTRWAVCECLSTRNQSDPYCCENHKWGPDCDQCADDQACPPLYKCSHKIVGATYYLCNGSVDPFLTTLIQEDYPRAVPQVQAKCEDQLLQAVRQRQGSQASADDSVTIVCQRTNCTAYSELNVFTKRIVAGMRTTTTISCLTNGSCTYAQAELLDGNAFQMGCEAASCFPNLDLLGTTSTGAQLEQAEQGTGSGNDSSSHGRQDGTNCTLTVQGRFPFVPDHPAPTAPFFTCQLHDCAATTVATTTRGK